MSTAHAGTRVLLSTNFGDITIELADEKAPKSVANFLQYVDDGSYSNVIFHRVINGFMIQGGGFDTNLQQKKGGTPIANEADNGLKNDRYSVAMARTNDPHSASNQFFINVVDNDFLNHSAPTPQGWGYTVFANVRDGFAVVDSIAKVKTSAKGPFGSDVPVEDVVILSASRVQ